MKILVIDPILFLAPVLAQRLVRDGHEVVYAPIWGPESDSPYVDVLCSGLGIKVDPEGWMNWIDWADVATLSGSEHRGHIANFLRKAGVPVCGPGRWGVRLELDRSFGHRIFKEAGMRPSTQRMFTTAEEAMNFIKDNPSQYVLKLDQTARAIAETFVGEDTDGRDLISYLEDLEAELDSTDGRVKLYLEEPLDGVEVGIGLWFNGANFIGDPLVTFETAGGYAYDLRYSPGKFVDLDKLAAVLRKYKFHGVLDLNGFLTEEGEWRPIEWTPRWGAGTTEMWAHTAPDLGELLYAAATGQDADTVDLTVRGKVVVLVNIRDEDSKILTPMPVMLADETRWPVRVKEGSVWVRWPAKTSAGYESIPILLPQGERRIGMVVGVGDTPEEAFENVELLSERVKISNAYTEIGRAKDALLPQMREVSAYMTGKNRNPEVEWVQRVTNSFLLR